jgi:hypothetical protein
MRPRAFLATRSGNNHPRHASETGVCGIPLSWVDGAISVLPPPIRAVVERARKEDILLYSASLAFYALVSLVPTIILVLWVTSLILGDHRVEDMARQIERVAPKNLALTLP